MKLEKSKKDFEKLIANVDGDMEWMVWMYGNEAMKPTMDLIEEYNRHLSFHIEQMLEENNYLEKKNSKLEDRCCKLLDETVTWKTKYTLLNSM